jgi:hypothetical protein
MPRYARLEAPGGLHHLVSRFVNEDFRLTNAFERQGYLDRVPLALKRSDWGPLCYALMSSHVHHGGMAGLLPSSSFMKPLNSATATWLNRLQERLGPVFADRHRSILFDEEKAARLLAYIHNNPVRAGVVRDPSESSWTSHRAYLGLEPAPPWLDVERGLSLCGFDSTPSGRLSFHEFVVSRSGEPRSPELTAAKLADTRARVRELLGSAVEVSWPEVKEGRTSVALVVPRGGIVRAPWQGTPLLLVQFVSERLAIDMRELCGRGRGRASHARRLILHLWTWHLGRSQAEIRPYLGLAASSASELLRSKNVDWRAIDRECEALVAELQRTTEQPRSVPCG